MSDIAAQGPGPSRSASDRDDLVRALTVERFTRWIPSTSTQDRADTEACPTVRDGWPFEPSARSVRARKYRRNTAVPRRNR